MSSARTHATTLNNISSEAVERATGRGWDAWLTLLDADHATALPHPEIVQLLRTKHGVASWWSQMITVGYEQARGLRVKHQKPGGFDISASRTMDCPVSEAYAAFAVPAKRRGWCPATVFTIRRATHSRNLRITWGDESDVSVMFYERGLTRCTVTVEHSKLASATDAAGHQKGWREALEKLAERLEAGDYSRVKAPREEEPERGRGGRKSTSRAGSKGKPKSKLSTRTPAKKRPRDS